MAGGVAVPTSAGHEFPGRITVYVLFASLVAASGGLLFGYDIGVTGGVTTQPAFLQKFFPAVWADQQSATSTSSWCKYDSQLLQLFTSSLFLAGMLGGALASFTTSRLGRVRTMLFAGLFFLLGAALTSCAVSTPMLVLGRVSLGLGVGAANQAVPLYLSEVAPARARGALNIMFQMATTLGILGGQLINYGTQFLVPWGWRLSLGLAGVPAIVLTLGGIFLPETPNNLVERKHMERGKEVLQKLRGADIDVNDEFEDITQASEVAARMRQPFSAIFKKDHRPQLTWSILIPAFQQLTGINAIMFYSTPLFSTLGFGNSASLFSAVIIGAVNVVATIISIVTVDRVGRRLLFLIGGGVMFVSQIVIAILLALEFGDGTSSMSSGAASGVIAIICIYVSGFACSWGPLGWLVPSEIQPLETRSAGQSITVATNFLFTFVIGQAFLSMLCSMQFGIFLFFAGWVALMTAAIFFFLPETKGVPIEDMREVWRMHWFWARVCPAPGKGSAAEGTDSANGTAGAADVGAAIKAEKLEDGAGDGDKSRKRSMVSIADGSRDSQGS